MGQNGNVQEWQESALTAPNDNSTEARAIRGGHWGNTAGALNSSQRLGLVPTVPDDFVGFRVASVVPEPSSALLVLGSGMIFLLRRRRASVS